MDRDTDREATGHDTTPSALPPHRRSARNPGARTVLLILAIGLVVLLVTWLLGGL